MHADANWLNECVHVQCIQIAALEIRWYNFAYAEWWVLKLSFRFCKSMGVWFLICTNNQQPTLRLWCRYVELYILVYWKILHFVVINWFLKILMRIVAQCTVCNIGLGFSVDLQCNWKEELQVTGICCWILEHTNQIWWPHWTIQ